MMPPVAMMWYTWSHASQVSNYWHGRTTRYREDEELAWGSGCVISWLLSADGLDWRPGRLGGVSVVGDTMDCKGHRQ